MFRFTIRELLLLTLVVGLAVAWWVDSRRKVFQREQLRVEAWKWKADSEQLANILTDSGWEVVIDDDGLHSLKSPASLAAAKKMPKD